MKSKLKQLYKDFKIIQDEIHILENKEFINENKQKIGQCFKFKNSYSCPETETDYWWIYKRVLSLDKFSNHFISFSFEIDKHGDCSTNKRTFDMLSGWTKCPEAEYLEAWQKFKQRIFDIQV